MSKHIVSDCIGYCPELNCEKNIDVTFTEIRAIGMPHPQYKKMGFYCDYAGEHRCTSAGEGGENCPIYKEAIL